MKKNTETKNMILDQLRKNPIVEVACQKANISRMTFYRWKKDDQEFEKQVDEALSDGRFLVNDVAESQLIGAVKDRNLPAITYGLKHHHPSYTTRVEVTAKLQNLNQKLTPEQQTIVDQALKLAALSDSSGNERNKKDE